ncbi:MAG: hypothetical protein Q4E83_05645 [bacterium]|nr:hypothetical protein [bacterium]
MNNESVGKKIVEALKKQAENIDFSDNIETPVFEKQITENVQDNIMNINDDIFAEPAKQEKNMSFFDDINEEKVSMFDSQPTQNVIPEASNESFEMPSNIMVLKKLISQLPSGVSRHTGAQIIKQTMEALGISMKSVLQDAQQVQEGLKVSARECQSAIQEYKKQILTLEKQSQGYQKQYSALNDLISLFIQTTK